MFWKGEDLLKAGEQRMRSVRGGEIGMIFQDPLTALNPVHTVGRQIAEMARIHERLNRRRPGRGRSRCSGWSASRNRPAASTTTRTSSPAACASGR